jgi:Holliday junction resolvasome RuvABC endonuclease subunit
LSKKTPKERMVKLADTPVEFTVLGLDCSSSVVGWGLIGCKSDKSLILLAHGHIKPLDSKYELFVRLNDIFDRIGQLCSDLSPTYIAIEDIFTYIKGKSTAKTITILTAFNRVIGLAAYKKNENVLLYSVNKIRPMIRKSYSIKEKIEKHQIPDIIRKYLEPSFGDISNKLGNISKTTYDESDGIAVAWACALDIPFKRLTKEFF